MDFIIPNHWLKLSDVDFNNKEIEMFHVDTRDFCVLLINKTELSEYSKFPDYSEIKYIEKYLYNINEIKERLQFLMNESGGSEAEWRCLDLNHIDDKMRILQNWNMKYIRIYRYENSDKFLVCNNNLYVLRREFFLDSKIIKEHL